MSLAQASGSESGEQERAGAASGRDRTEAFAHAARHSRKVRLLKFVLPVLAVLIASAFFGYTYLVSPEDMVMEAEAQTVTDGKIVMANPKLNGMTKDGRAYGVTAARAIQDINQQTMIELEKIDARLPFDSDSWASIQAERGVYDSQSNTLDLPSAISVQSDNGLVAVLASAYIDVGKGALTTQQPVDIRLDGSRITSDTMQVIDNGKVLIFEKQVRVTIDPKRYRQAESQEGVQNARQ